jgi:hypothetical protein
VNSSLPRIRSRFEKPCGLTRPDSFARSVAGARPDGPSRE